MSISTQDINNETFIHEYIRDTSSGSTFYQVDVYSDNNYNSTNIHKQVLTHIGVHGHRYRVCRYVSIFNNLTRFTNESSAMSILFFHWYILVFDLDLVGVALSRRTCGSCTVT